MHDIRAIVQNPEQFEKRISRRGKMQEQLSEVLALAKERRELNVALEQVRQEQAKANQQMKTLAQAGDRAGIESARTILREQADKLKASEDRVKLIEERISALLMRFTTEGTELAGYSDWSGYICPDRLASAATCQPLR